MYEIESPYFRPLNLFPFDFTHLACKRASSGNRKAQKLKREEKMPRMNIKQQIYSKIRVWEN